MEGLLLGLLGAAALPFGLALTLVFALLYVRAGRRRVPLDVRDLEAQAALLDESGPTANEPSSAESSLATELGVPVALLPERAASLATLPAEKQDGAQGRSRSR